MGILDKRDEMENKMLYTQTYPWAYKHFKDGRSNNWTPEEVSMLTDREQWQNDSLTPEEKNLVMYNLKLFASAEALTQDNIAMALFPYIQDGYARMYMMRQAFEEALHTDTFLYIVDSLGFNLKEIYEGYYDVPSIKEKDDFLISFTQGVSLDSIDISTIEGKQALFKNMFGFFFLLEGISFYGNFAQILSLGRANKMPGLTKQIEYILRDEGIHVDFGFDLMNTIKQEYPEIWTEDFKSELNAAVRTAVDLERIYNKGSMQKGLLGLNAEVFDQYIQYIADRRLDMLGLGAFYGSENPFPWLGAAQDLLKETNFFENKPTEYQTKALKMDDF